MLTLTLLLACGDKDEPTTDSSVEADADTDTDADTDADADSDADSDADTDPVLGQTGPFEMVFEVTNLEFTDTCTGVANSGWLDDGLSVAGDWECSFSGDLAQFGTMSGGIEGLKDEENEGQMSGVLTSGPPLGDVEWTGSWTETTQYGEFSFEFSEQGFDIVGDGTFTTSE